MSSLPSSLPPLPSVLTSGAATIKEQIVERTSKKAYREEILRVYRCECQRCGAVWRTKEFVLPKACASCHNSYWDRPAMWKRKTAAERERLKLQKRLEKKQKQIDFNNKLKEQLDAILEEARSQGEDVSKLEKKAAKFLVEALKADVKTKKDNPKPLEVLAPVGDDSYSELSSGVPDILSEILPEESQGSYGISNASFSEDGTYQDVQVGLSVNDGSGEDNSD
jgi:hypothetical protein